MSETSAPEPEQLTQPGDVETLVRLLASKADNLSNQVTALLPKMENFIGVSVAVLVGAVTLGVTQEHPVILVLLPFPLIILFGYLLQCNTEMLSRAGHKRFLEETVNELLKRRVLLEESDVAPRTLHGRTQFGRLSIIMIQSFMVLLLAASIVLAVTRLDTVKATMGRIGFWSAMAAGIAFLLIAAREQSRAYNGGYEAAKLGFAGALEPTTPLVHTTDD